MEKQKFAPGARLLSVKLRNREGEEIGQVREWIMDIDEGKVVFVLAAIEQKSELTPIPWSAMQADREKGGYRIDPGLLKNMPTISPQNLASLVEDQQAVEKIILSFNPEKREEKASDKTQISQTENIELSEGKGYDYPNPETFKKS